MQKTLVVLLACAILSSCTKSKDLSNVSLITLANSPVVIEETKISGSQSNLKFILNGKSFNAVARLTDSADFQKFDVSDSSGIEYFSYLIDTSKHVSKFHVVRDLPVSALDPGGDPDAHRPDGITPISIPHINLDLLSCMKRQGGKCAGEFTCLVLCSTFTFITCNIIFAFGCL